MKIINDKSPLNNKYFLHFQLAFALLAILSAVGYVLFTNHIWEDFFITFKYSKNLAEGNGLVYHINERVHGFTSVINTLLPALFYYISGESSFLPALWLYRIVSIAFYVATGLYIIRFLNKDKDTPIFSLVFFALYFLFVIKTIAYTTNGQEAGFLIFFVLVPLLLIFDSAIKNWKLIGLLWAGLMYTRPDGFIYIAAMSLTTLILTNENKKELLNVLAKAGFVCGVVYLPWFIFTWVYYGTPVPHTIIAKSVYSLHYNSDFISVMSGLIEQAPTIFSRIFLPIYPEFGGWPYWTKMFAYFSGLFCTIYWLLPVKDKLGKHLSLFFFLILIYLNFVNTRGFVFSWYLTAMETLGVVILSRGVFYFITLYIKNIVIAIQITILINTLILTSLANLYFSTLLQIKIQQEIIEDGNRKQIGYWLKNNASPGDSVFLEPLGYIGYFSELKMYDFPGLVSPETVRIIKSNNSLNQSLVVEKLQPDWLVLREELAKNIFSSRLNKSRYKHIITFDVRNKISKYKDIHGYGYLNIDALYYIYTKK